MSSSSKGRNAGKSKVTASSTVKKESTSSTVKKESTSSTVKKEYPESNIVPFTGHSPIPLVNHYSALGSTLSPNMPSYQSALVNQFDPYKSSPSSKTISVRSSKMGVPSSSRLTACLMDDLESGVRCFSHQE
ncbi:hypothetical protein ACLB2K_035490 [Fragaria x ananassa]